MYQLEQGERCDDGIRRILTEQVDAGIALLTEPTDNRDKAIHDARKGLKRIRAALRLIRDELGDEIYQRENRCYRDVGRMLADLRDSAVLVETLDMLVARFQMDLPEGAFAAIRARLVERQFAIRHAMLYEGTAAEEAAVMLVEARARIPELPIAHSDFQAYAGGMLRVYGRGRRRMALAYMMSDPERFHDWRKRVKYLWHHLEILYPMSPWRNDVEIRELRKIARLLGDAHDMVVLKETLLDPVEAFEPTAEREQLSALCDLGRLELEAAARPYGLRMFADRAPSFVARMGTYFGVWQTTGVSGVPLADKSVTQPVMLSTAEAAAQLGLSRSAVRAMIRNGRLAANKVGHVWIIHPDAISEGESDSDL